MVLGVVVWQAATWPDVRALEQGGPPPTTAFIERYREQERAGGRTPRLEWRWVPYAAISTTLKRAVLVAEDNGFFRHHGFAADEMRDAVRRAIEAHALPRGALTITQQLAKNLWLSSSRNPLRKVKEGVLTWQLERALSKRRIFELYLNVAQFGPGVYGAEAAARRYFRKPAAELSADEAAELAAGLPRPRAWHPGISTPGYRRYVESVRRRMDRAEIPERLLR